MDERLRPVATVLAQRTTPCTVFFRDDDAGWEDARLFALLDVFERHCVPVDLAVIPAALTPALARALLQRMARTGQGGLGVHQHGFAHLNHEAEGRKCEFGPSRSFDEQLACLEQGHALLAASFGTMADRIFTPPWNRCTADTAQALAHLGFEALSRDHTARPIDDMPLREIPVAVDWCKLRPPGSSSDALVHRIAGRVAEAEVCGIMLHHAVMDAVDLDVLDSLLPLLREHPHCRCAPMSSLLDDTMGLTAHAA